jgi:NAD(P)-dependent dehydrogenase (short-subunit alcohol dehydrogenase family)
LTLDDGLGPNGALQRSALSGDLLCQMAKTIVVAGYGPGISTSVAEKFGAEGFQVAIVGRSAEKLAAGVKALESKGVKAASFTANLGEPDAVRGVIEKVRAAFGPISVIEWTAYTPGNVAGDLFTATSDEIRSLVDVGVIGLITAVQTALPDLKKREGRGPRHEWRRRFRRSIHGRPVRAARHDGARHRQRREAQARRHAREEAGSGRHFRR